MATALGLVLQHVLPLSAAAMLLTLALPTYPDAVPCAGISFVTLARILGVQKSAATELEAAK